MENKHILKYLLDKYYQGKTSFTEEALLSEIFTIESNLGEYEKYRSEFLYANLLKQKHTKRDFTLQKEQKNNLPKRSLLIKKVDRRWLQLAASVLLFISAFSIGRLSISPEETKKDELTELKEEVKTLRTIILTTMINQPLASDRIKAVQLAKEFSNIYDDQIVQLLVKYLNEDNNINVRLASIDVLTEFRRTAELENRLLESLLLQTSPIAQMEILQLIKNSKVIVSKEKLREFLNQGELDPYVVNTAENIIKSL